MTAPTSADDGVHRLLFGAYPDALLLVDAGGTIVLANPAAARLFGHAELVLQGMSVDALVPQAIRPRHAAYRAGYATAPRARPMGMQSELVALRADGTEVRVEIALSPLQSQGRPYVVAAVRDIGDYPRVRQALQRARYSECVAEMGRIAVDARVPQLPIERIPVALREVLEVDSAAVFRLDADRQAFRLVSGSGSVADALPALLLPNRPDSGLGQLAVSRAPLVVPDLARENRFDVHPEIVALGLHGAAAVPLSDQGRVTGAIAVWTRKARDFGDEELRLLEALASLLATTLQRADSEAALRHSQRLESVGQLTGGIAHDFNNLLTVIQGNLQVLEEHGPVAGDAVAAGLVAAALGASRRGAGLTGKLLAFSRRALLQPERVDIGALLQSLADMLRRTLDQRISIVVDAPASAVFGHVDPGQLESALLNIAINARDAMPGGGRLSLSVRPCDGLPDRRYGAADQIDEEVAAAGYLAIAVSDSGQGMSEEVRARAFEPFYTTKEAGRGTGLGLSTVYGFVRQSQGAVTIDSQPGVGSTVTLVLPRSTAAAAELAAETVDGQPRAGLSVLLVEDEAEVRNVVTALLEGLGCTVLGCADAAQALHCLDVDGPFDLLLSDVVLGAGPRGTDLVGLAERRQPGLPVLLMSGFSANAADTLPTTPLLRKPFSRAELARAIVRLTGGRAADRSIDGGRG